MEQSGGREFSELVAAHQSMVFSLAFHFLRERELAEEVAQDVFVSLHKHLAALTSAAHIEFWLRRVTAQRAIDESRRRRRRPQVSLDEVSEPAALFSLADPMLGEALRRVITSLPEMARMVMILRYQEDLSPSEIAETLELPVATVKSHLQRSLALVREKLTRRCGEVRL